MSLIRFRQITLSKWNALIVKDPDTRFTVLNEDGTIYGEFVGDVPIFARTKVDGATIVQDEHGVLRVSPNLKIDGGEY